MTIAVIVQLGGLGKGVVLTLMTVLLVPVRMVQPVM